MNLPDDLGKPPDPWHYDSVRLLQELDRIRVLILKVPHTPESHGPTQTALDAVWRLQEDLRYLLRLHTEGQFSFPPETRSDGSAIGFGGTFGETSGQAQPPARSAAAGLTLQYLNNSRIPLAAMWTGPRTLGELSTHPR